jgi:hypothetical protein
MQPWTWRCWKLSWSEVLKHDCDGVCVWTVKVKIAMLYMIELLVWVYVRKYKRGGDFQL